jgi:apolipoprotein N-acyltransferase
MRGGLGPSTVEQAATATATSPAPRRRVKVPGQPSPSEQPGTARVYLAAVGSGVAISVAWWVPGTIASALLGWIAALLLVYAVRARRAYAPAYCAGLACCALGFYWVFRTVAVFGGFGPVAAAVVFALFVTASAVQFLIFAFFHHNLGLRLDAWALRAPTALVLSEFIAIRVFHWHFGHTQIALTPLVQIAGIGGALLVSFLMFWIAEVAVRIVVFRDRRWSFVAPMALLGAALLYGTVMVRIFTTPEGARARSRLDVLLVQGNAPMARERDPEAIGRNVGRLFELSARAPHQNALIVWPEGAIPAFLPAELRSVRTDPILPWFGDGSAFLVGAYAIDLNDKRYNAAFAVAPDGTVGRPYFKQVLIPFGEYMPLATWLPWIKSLNANAGVFSAGSEVQVFEYPMRRPDTTWYTLRVAPLVCYEDTLPALARTATLKGAELLVNLTYDTWFGQSAAPFEHHLIAAFRAIENRRYLVRVTNNGYSAVVDPLGRTIARIPPFAEGTAAARVDLLTYRSTYTHYVGDRPWWGLLALSLGVIAVRRWRGIPDEGPIAPIQ